MRSGKERRQEKERRDREREDRQTDRLPPLLLLLGLLLETSIRILLIIIL